MHDPELIPFGLKLKRHGKKVIFDSHENYVAQIREKTYLNPIIRKTIAGAYKMFETYALKRFDAVVVPCSFDGINIFKGRAKKVSFIANYPTAENFASKYDPTIQKEFDICYVGGLTESRGIGNLVEACGKADCSLLLAGRFSDEAFEEKVKAMPGFKNVTYLGEIPNASIAREIQRSRIGANPLLDVGQYHHIDTFGIKVYEYMAMGVPVLMPDYYYAREQIAEAKFGVCVDTGDTDAMAEAIKGMLQDERALKEMGEIGRILVDARYNWKTQEELLLGLYEGL
ncbi:MAG: glycosyltransferase, partial [Clostridiales bacterium]|nr:glycosyltransferase [Candidatus Crickella merdequi]